MAVIVNPDGSIFVGVLREEKIEKKAVEKKETSSPQPEKKPTKKKSK